MEIRKKIGLFLGPLLFLITYFSPILSQNPKAHRLLAVFFLVITWWVTECIPIPITALLIPVFITLFRISSIQKALSPFANPIIMLFLGSFILARAMCVHSLDRKLAYSVLSLKSVKHSQIRVLFAFGLLSLFLSMWISNTATTAMMYPIAMGVLASFHQKEEGKGLSFKVILLLTLAYSASIGGIGTPIGSPPNLIAIGMLEKLAGYKIDFFQWMIIGFVILIPMYTALFFFMKHILKKNVSLNKALKMKALDESEISRKLTRPQKNVLTAFSLTVFLWTFPGIISLTLGKAHPLSLWLQQHIPESAAALIGAGLLFLLPVDLSKGRFTITLKDAMNIDWGTLLLFGGGLSLGFHMFETGLADIIGNYLISLGGKNAGLALITFISIVFSVLLTEVTSNTASANMIIPIIIALSHAASINPLAPVLGSAIGCSFAFLLPVATPPNAIIYGSGIIKLPQMIKAGFWLEVIGVFVIWSCLCLLFLVFNVI
ncbi:MAG TPA: DASS family sodium-coupled anion symporter [Candidatus Aminicenantes bacterium]|nr:DASS family sodium-coupled anion symporter [Candidatus Aminicenantes bacterium]